MKKTSILLVIILCIGLAGCTSEAKDATGSSEKLSELQKKVSVLEKENMELKEQIEKLKGSDAAEDTKAVAGEVADKPSVLKAGDKITTDNMEIKIKKVELTYDVLPDKTNGVYTHYAADSGEVYIHVDVDVKNLQKQALPCDEIMTVEADYNNGYTYNSFAVPEDSLTGFTYANITAIDPLQTKGVRYLISCPQEVDKEKNPLVLTFKLDKQEYIYTIR